MLQKESYQVFAVKRMSSLTQQKKSIVYVAPTSLLIALEIFRKQDHPLRGQTNLVDDAAGAVKHLRDDRRHRSHNRSFCLCLGLQRESM